MTLSRLTNAGILALVVVLIVLVGLWAGRGGAVQTRVEAPPIPVALADVTAAPGAGDVVVTGRVKAVREAKLAFKIAGRIKALKVDVGDKVSKGQVLAELDGQEIDAQTLQAKVGLDKAKRDLARAEELLRAGFAPQQRVDDARTALDVAKATLDSVTFNRDLARIVADQDGVVLARSAETGEIIAAGVPIITLGDLSAHYLVRAGLADRDVARIALGDPARARLNAAQDQQIDGTVTRIAAQSDARTGTFDVEVTLVESRSGLHSGAIADLAITPSKPGEDTEHLAVPVDAVLEAHGDEAQVYVVDAGGTQAQRRRVRIGALKGDVIVITKGLRLGERVVVRGAAYLRDGTKVAVTTDEAKP